MLKDKKVLLLITFLGASLCAYSCASSHKASDPVTPEPASSSISESISDPQCQTAKDCKGRVPHFCIACNNGNTGGCAHWSCVENTCKVSTCDIAPSQ